MSCHLHAEDCDCPAYLIAMGENDRLLEADLQREEAKTVIARNVAVRDNKSSARIGAANSNPGLISKTTGGSQVTETTIVPPLAQSAPQKTPNWVCTECGSVYMESEVLVALNPFQLWETIYGCPACREPNSFAECCDEEGCETPWTFGWNSPSGYRCTCNQHAPTYSFDAPPFDSDEVAG